MLGGFFFASHFKHVRKIAELTIQNTWPDFLFRLYRPISEMVGGLQAKKNTKWGPLQLIKEENIWKGTKKSATIP